MESRPIGDLAVDVPVLDHGATCARVRDLFVEAPHLSSVLVRGREGIALIDRAAFDALTMRDDEEALDSSALRVADMDPLILPHDMDLLDAAGHVLDRPGRSQYEDVVVSGPLQHARAVPVSRMLAELSQLYRHQARHDVLTGLANRTLVVEQLTAMLSRTQRHGGMVAAMFVDLDDFKQVNDTHGHQAGDRLLLHVAQRLRDAARTHDVVGRIGGDEFVVAATVNSLEDLPGLGSRIVEALEAPFPIDGGPAVRVRASVGIAIDDGGRTADELLRLADNAMYTAKRSVGSKVAFHHQLPVGAHASSHAEDRVLADLLARALDEETLRLAFQPVVGLESGELLRLEVLTRMPLPDGEMVPPDRFVAVAERCDLIGRLGRWVLDQSLAQIDTWDRELGLSAPPAIGLNLSPLECHDPRMVRHVATALEAYGTDPKRLWVEFPETAATFEDPSLLRAMHELRQLGVQISIDDFGVGEATLARLAQLPIDELKIDQSLIAGFSTETAQRQVVRMIIGLARELGVQAVAEGVETDEQVRLLRLLDCPAVQGYRFGHPMWAHEVELWLAQRPA